jgi:hypothetical protein
VFRPPFDNPFDGSSPMASPLPSSAIRPEIHKPVDRTGHRVRIAWLQRRPAVTSVESRVSTAISLYRPPVNRRSYVRLSWPRIPTRAGPLIHTRVLRKPVNSDLGGRDIADVLLVAMREVPIGT